jgi:Protein of unknown function (DUF3987)
MSKTNGQDPANNSGYDIRDRLSVLTKSKASKTKYYCPVCQGDDLDINPRSGAYSCFSGGCDSKDIRVAIDKLEGKPEWKPEQDDWVKPVRPKSRKEYFYPDRDGNPLVKVVRIDPGDGSKKSFPQYHWDGSKWVTGNPDEVKKLIPIYRRAEAIEAIGRGELVFILEGEAAVDAAWELGIPATTTIGGAGKFGAYGDYTEDLDGGRFALTPDRDTAGVKHMGEIAEFLGDRVKGYYLAGTQGLWRNPQGGMDIGDDIRDHRLTKEQILAKVISPQEYAEIVNPPSATEQDRREETQQLEAELSELLNKKNQLAPSIFGGELGQELANTAANFNIPLEIFSACLLPVLASQIPAKSRLMISPGTNYKVPPIVWVGMVGESGTMKTPILNILTSPLSVIQGEIAETWKLNKVDYEKELSSYKLRKKGERGEEPQPLSPMQDVYFSDFTIESICQSVSDYPNKGYLTFVDELAGFFKSMDAYRKGGGDRQKWLDFYNGCAVKVNRKGSDTLFAPHSSLSILGGLQPSVLERLIKKDDSAEDGLWNRFIFVHLPQSKMEAFPDYSFGLSERLKTVYQRLSNQPEREYKLSDESKPVWTLWHDLMEDKVWNEPSNLLRATYAKFKGAAARIALVLHCVGAAIADRPPETSVSPETLSTAIAFTKWLLDQTLLEYQRIGLLDDPKLNRIFKFIDKFDGRDWINAQTVKAWWSAKTKPAANGLRSFMAEVVALGHAIDNGELPTSSKYQILITKKGSPFSPKTAQTQAENEIEGGLPVSPKFSPKTPDLLDSNGLKNGLPVSPKVSPFSDLTELEEARECDLEKRTKVSPNGSPFSEPLPDIGLGTIDRTKRTNGSPVLETIPSKDCEDYRTKRTTTLDSKKLKVGVLVKHADPYHERGNETGLIDRVNDGQHLIWWESDGDRQIAEPFRTYSASELEVVAA